MWQVLPALRFLGTQSRSSSGAALSICLPVCLPGCLSLSRSVSAPRYDGAGARRPHPQRPRQHPRAGPACPPHTKADAGVAEICRLEDGFRLQAADEGVCWLRYPGSDGIPELVERRRTEPARPPSGPRHHRPPAQRADRTWHKAHDDDLLLHHGAALPDPHR